MSYFLNDELELLQESAREFAEQYVAPAVAGMEESNEFPRDLYLKAGELGFLSLIVPEQIGGAGMGLTAVGVVAEEIAKVSPAFAISFYVDSCMVSYLMESPNREVLLKKYLPGLMTGWTVMAAGITPPQGSTNIPEWPVLAKRDGDDWILNGSKLYVTNCGKADLVAFVGLTEDGEMRCFIVETSDPGVDDDHIESKLGLAGNGSGSYFLTDVRVSDEYSFPKNPLEGMGPGNALCAAVALGCAEGALARTMDFVKERSHKGKPVGARQVVSRADVGSYRAISCPYLRSTRHGRSCHCRSEPLGGTESKDAHQHGEIYRMRNGRGCDEAMRVASWWARCCGGDRHRPLSARCRDALRGRRNSRPPCGVGGILTWNAGCPTYRLATHFYDETERSFP